MSRRWTPSCCCRRSYRPGAGASGVANHGGWSVPELDELVRQAAEAVDPAERLKLEEQALRIAKEEVLLIPWHQQPIAWASRDRVESIDLRADNKPRDWFTTVTP